MSTEANTALAARFFEGIVQRDADAVRSCVAPGFRVWTNVSEEIGVEEIIGFFALMEQQVPDFHYEKAVRTSTSQGFVEEHRVVGTAPSGERFDFPLCAIGEVQDGLIVSMREYADAGDMSKVGIVVPNQDAPAG